MCKYMCKTDVFSPSASRHVRTRRSRPKKSPVSKRRKYSWRESQAEIFTLLQKTLIRQCRCCVSVFFGGDEFDVSVKTLTRPASTDLDFRQEAAVAMATGSRCFGVTATAQHPHNDKQTHYTCVGTLFVCLSAFFFLFCCCVLFIKFSSFVVIVILRFCWFILIYMWKTHISNAQTFHFCSV